MHTFAVHPLYCINRAEIRGLILKTPRLIELQRNNQRGPLTKM